MGWLSKTWKKFTSSVNDIVGDDVYDAVGGSAAILNPGLGVTQTAAKAGAKASGLNPDDPPPPVDPAAAAQQAQDEATIAANKRLSGRRRSLRGQSLLATGAQGVTSSAPLSSLLAQGKASLGA